MAIEMAKDPRRPPLPTRCWCVLQSDAPSTWITKSTFDASMPLAAKSVHIVILALLDLSANNASSRSGWVRVADSF